MEMVFMVDKVSGYENLTVSLKKGQALPALKS